MRRAQEIALQAYADISDNELSLVIEAECERIRLDAFAQFSDSRLASRRQKNKSAMRRSTSTRVH